MRPVEHTGDFGHSHFGHVRFGMPAEQEQQPVINAMESLVHPQLRGLAQSPEDMPEDMHRVRRSIEDMTIDNTQAGEYNDVRSETMSP